MRRYRKICFRKHHSTMGRKVNDLYLHLQWTKSFTVYCRKANLTTNLYQLQSLIRFLVSVKLQFFPSLLELKLQMFDTQFVPMTLFTQCVRDLDKAFHERSHNWLLYYHGSELWNSFGTFIIPQFIKFIFLFNIILFVSTNLKASWHSQLIALAIKIKRDIFIVSFIAKLVRTVHFLKALGIGCEKVRKNCISVVPCIL